MGEEQKKPEEKKPEEGKKAEEAEKAAGAGEEKKKDEGEKKTDDGGGGGKDSGKDGKEEEKAVPPPPPPEIVLRVYMHCEGCARKVKKSLRGFNGVEDVVTDCKNHTVVVKGEKADPLKVLDRVQRKSHRHVELLSPIPKPPSEEEAKKPSEPEPPKEEKIEEPKVVTVVLKVHMHCEACAQEIKKRIERMKEVEVATPDLKTAEVTVKGTFDPPKLVEYVHRKTGKHVVIVKQEPAEEAAKEEGEKKGKEEEKGEGGGEEKKGGDGGNADPKAAAAVAVDEKKEGGGEVAAAAAEEETKVEVELRRSEYCYYPPKYAMEMYHDYPPQIFSDENPNACSIM